MGTNPSTAPRSERSTPARQEAPARGGVAAYLLGGSVAGNEQLTAMTGLLLVLLLAVIGVTILRIHQLIWVHLFVGLVLIGPVALKLASTGYRFARYYTGNTVYHRKGPPPASLRLLAPLVVLSTIVVFASGLVLLFDGPAGRGTWLLVHKASFIAWLALTALHVIGHLPEMPASLQAARAERAQLVGSRAGGAGSAGRWIALAGVCAAGLVLALLLVPEFALWTRSGAFLHHH